jgi:type I restriction enzyme S subunit
MIPKLNPHIPRVWLPHLRNQNRSIASTEYLILRPIRCTKEFFYLHFCLPETKEYMSNRADGTSTSHKRIKPEDFLRQLIITPPEAVAQQFGSFTRPMLNLVASLLYRNTTLIRTRDLILSKLISGEVDVSDLDIKVPEKEIE